MAPKQTLFSNKDVKLVSIHLKGQGVAQWQSSGSNTSTEKKKNTKNFPVSALLYILHNRND